jgi:hypothetical protein
VMLLRWEIWTMAAVVLLALLYAWWLSDDG